MKTNNLFRVLFTLVALVILNYAANAQLTTTHTTPTVNETVANEATDYVTIGARVPYNVSGDIGIWGLVSQGIMDQSIYKWAVTGGRTLYRVDGSNAALAGTEVTAAGVETFLAGDGYYSDTIIAVDFTGATSGTTYTLSVAERSVSNTAGMVGCIDASVEDLAIVACAAPTVVFNTAGVYTTGGCGTDALANNDVPITVSGSNTLRLTYRVQYTNLYGTTVDSIASGTVINDGTGTFNTGWTALSVNNGATNTFLPFSIIDGRYGTYTITLEGVTDRILRKSMDAVTDYIETGLPGGIAGTSATVGRTYRIYAFPTPTTGRIRHVTNLGW